MYIPLLPVCWSQGRMWRSVYSWKVITVLPSLLFWLNMRVCVLLRLTLVCPCVDSSWDLRKHRVDIS